MRASSRLQGFAGVRVVVLAALCGSGWAMVGCSKSISDKDIQPISLAQVRTLMESSRPGTVLLIDPRSPAAFAQGHIAGARNLPLDAVNERQGIDPELARYSTLVVYGEDPGTGTGRAMAKRLMTVGYRNVKLFFGGLGEWRRAGLEVRSAEGAGAVGGAAAN